MPAKDSVCLLRFPQPERSAYFHHYTSGSLDVAITEQTWHFSVTQLNFGHNSNLNVTQLGSRQHSFQSAKPEDRKNIWRHADHVRHPQSQTIWENCILNKSNWWPGKQATIKRCQFQLHFYKAQSPDTQDFIIACFPLEVCNTLCLLISLASTQVFIKTYATDCLWTSSTLIQILSVDRT